MSKAADLFPIDSLVLHAPTGIVGRVRKVWEAGDYVFAYPIKVEAEAPNRIGLIAGPNAARCEYPVVELSTGDRFVLRPDEPGALRSLAEAEAHCYAEVLLPFMLAAARSAKAMTGGTDVFDPNSGNWNRRQPLKSRSIGALFMAAARAALIEAGIKLPGAEQ